jgi:hypothetical protein
MTYSHLALSIGASDLGHSTLKILANSACRLDVLHNRWPFARRGGASGSAAGFSAKMLIEGRNHENPDCFGHR